MNEMEVELTETIFLSLAKYSFLVLDTTRNYQINTTQNFVIYTPEANRMPILA
jgi:hypothetical protein